MQVKQITQTTWKGPAIEGAGKMRPHVGLKVKSSIFITGLEKLLYQIKLFPKT